MQEQVLFDPIAASNPFFVKLAKHLNKYQRVSRRVNQNEDLKRGIAEYFWELYLTRIRRKKIDRLYFDCGSTMAYVAQEFMHKFLQHHGFKRAVRETEQGENFRIATNNIITLLDFILLEQNSVYLKTILLPTPPVDVGFGETLGPLQYIDQPPPLRSLEISMKKA